MTGFTEQRLRNLEVLCPVCATPSALTPELLACGACGRPFRNEFPVYDFVNSPDRTEERSFYDSTYTAARTKNCVKQSIDSVFGKWDLPQSPENKIVLAQLGDLADKSVLLLGNGESVKELLFLEMSPAHLVYSDLSTPALVNICERFDVDQYTNLSFAAIDAQAIPFANETFDIVYGFAVVHHLPDLDKFFASVVKALKPGGKAVFMDDAFAPMWHYSKQTWLKPLIKFSQKKSGISPEDYRFSMSGGFKEADLEKKIRIAGGNPWFI